MVHLFTEANIGLLQHPRLSALIVNGSRYLLSQRQCPEAVVPRSSVKRLTPAILLKKRLWHRCFPMNFAKFLRTPFITEHLWWLLVNVLRISPLREAWVFSKIYSVINLTIKKEYLSSLRGKSSQYNTCVCRNCKVKFRSV